MTPTQWQHHINAWQRSDKNKHSYCKNHGLSYSRFLYWSNKPVKPQPNSSAHTELVPVTITEPAPEMNTLGTLEFPNGTKLHIHSTELLSSLPALLSP